MSKSSNKFYISETGELKTTPQESYEKVEKVKDKKDSKDEFLIKVIEIFSGGAIVTEKDKEILEEEYYSILETRQKEIEELPPPYRPEIGVSENAKSTK